MTRTVSFRIPEDTARRVAERAAGWGLGSDSEVYRRVIEEWLRLQEHPGVRFVDGPAGRRAALVGGPDIWEGVAIARSFEWEAGRIREAYPWLTAERLETVRRYYDEFPDEIDAQIERNARAADDLERELEALGA